MPSTVKLDRNGLQFFYRHVLNKEWQWLDIVKPPQSKTLPDILTVPEVAAVINHTRQLRYQVFFLTLYSMGLRLGEGVSLQVCDIDSARMQVHIRHAKGGKDRFVPCKSRTRYLFNAFNLATVWRARLLGYLSKRTALTLPPNVPNKWVVDCKHVGKGLPALKYLSRYLYRGVLPDKDILSDIDGNISFAYQDSKTNTRKTRTLPATQFLWLILQHVLPKGFRRVRDYGLLHPNNNKLRQRIQHLLALIGNTLPVINPKPRKKAKLMCPCCKKPMQFMGIRARTIHFNSASPIGSS
ncbi:hypothetical protein PLUTE_b0111 [Pseudoalteromonas luteoviolacea DSM 6061]|nr:hypothetical protein [Pseudoalteromonas luteoviolacea DSM 6061]